MLKYVMMIILQGFVAHEIFTKSKKLLMRILVIANYMLLVLSYIAFHYFQNSIVLNFSWFFLSINITLCLYVELILKDKNGG